MNHDSPLEDRLRHQPLKPVPAGWREDILRQAARAVERRQPALVATVSWYQTLRSRLAGLLWPAPRAWGALAAVWVVILGLNFAARDTAPQRIARQSVPPSAEVRRLLRQQEELFVELVGATTKSAAAWPKPAALPPQSRRRDKFFTA